MNRALLLAALAMAVAARDGTVDLSDPPKPSELGNPDIAAKYRAERAARKAAAYAKRQPRGR